MVTSYVMRMSGASEATTEQYFSSERSIARRALMSSAPSPATPPAPPPRGKAEVEPGPPERLQGVIPEQPIERGAGAGLDAAHAVPPQRRAGGVRAAAVVAGDAEPAARVGHAGLVVGGEAVQRLEAGDVGVGAIEDPDLHGRPKPHAAGEEVAAVEPRAQHELTAVGHVRARPHAEPEQADAGAASRGLLHRRRVELLGGEAGGREHEERRNPRSPPHGVSPSSRAAVASGMTDRPARVAARP